MHKLKESFKKELYEFEDKAERNPNSKVSLQELQRIHLLSDSVKNFDKIEMLEDGGGYSEESNWMGEGRVYGTSYNDGGTSYRRGRGMNARRDRMGRYSREGNYSEENYSEEGNSLYHGGSSYGRGGNRGEQGYSRGDAKEYMLDQLEDMMEKAETTKEKEAIKHCIKQIESV